MLCIVLSTRQKYVLILKRPSKQKLFFSIKILPKYPLGGVISGLGCKKIVIPLLLLLKVRQVTVIFVFLPKI